MFMELIYTNLLSKCDLLLGARLDIENQSAGGKKRQRAGRTPGRWREMAIAYPNAKRPGVRAALRRCGRAHSKNHAQYYRSNVLDLVVLVAF